MNSNSMLHDLADPEFAQAFGEAAAQFGAGAEGDVAALARDIVAARRAVRAEGAELYEALPGGLAETGVAMWAAGMAATDVIAALKEARVLASSRPEPGQTWAGLLAGGDPN